MVRLSFSLVPFVLTLLVSLTCWELQGLARSHLGRLFFSLVLFVLGILSLLAVGFLSCVGSSTPVGLLLSQLLVLLDFSCPPGFFSRLLVLGVSGLSGVAPFLGISSLSLFFLVAFFHT